MAPPSPRARPTSIPTSFRRISAPGSSPHHTQQMWRHQDVARTRRQICPGVTQGQPFTKREFSPGTSAFVKSTSDLLGSNKISIPRLHTPVPMHHTCARTHPEYTTALGCTFVSRFYRALSRFASILSSLRSYLYFFLRALSTMTTQHRLLNARLIIL
jgi:hypothetical protein